MYGRPEGPIPGPAAAEALSAPLGDAEIQRLADRAEQGYTADELRQRNIGDEIRRSRHEEVSRLIEAGRAQLGDDEADRMQEELARRAARLDDLE